MITSKRKREKHWTKFLKSMDKVVYFYIEEGYAEPLPPEAIRFCTWAGDNNPEIIDANVCIAKRYENLVSYLYVTAPKSLISEKFPELLEYVKPKPFFPEHLDWKPENYGTHMLEPKYPDIDITDRLV